MRRPIIGISAYDEQATWGIWSGAAALLPRTYLDVTVRAGAAPVLLPAVPDVDAATSVLDGIDALVLSGGGDIDPAYYGARRHAKTATVRPERDVWEQALAAGALNRDLPVLGVCRGIQVLTVACGGTLRQHLPDDVDHHGHQPEPGTFGTTSVRVASGSRIAGIVGTRVDVACHHHQAVDALDTTGLRATAWAEDGTVEAVEHPEYRFAIGVQWHPEQRGEVALFDALAASVRASA